MNGSRPAAGPRPVRNVLRLLRPLIVLAAIVAALAVGNFSYALGVVIFVVGLLISVILHELGHFLTAKKFGMKATQFFIGFGPTIWSTTRGETEYGVKALPFGAFVKITGMTTMDEVDPADEPRAMRNKPRWQRAIVMVAGSFMHFALAFVLLILLGLAIGQPITNSTKVGQVSSCLAANATALDKGSCEHSRGPSPARQAGMKAGDVIVSVAGRKVHNWTDAGTAIRALPAGQPATVIVQRDGKQVTLHLTPATVPGRKGSYLGILQAEYFQRLNPGSAVTFAGSTIGQVLAGTAEAFGKLPSEVSQLFNRSHQSSGLTSVVGLAQGAGQAVEYGGGWQYTVFDLLQILILVNISVGALNLLPLLPLDGGHLAMLGYEQVRAWVARLRGRRDPGVADLQPLIPVSATVFVLLVGLSVLLIAANLFNPIHLIQ
jgi:membrane-associated protease RseP (regulator of RpoE activity)